MEKGIIDKIMNRYLMQYLTLWIYSFTHLFKEEQNSSLNPVLLT